MTKLQIVNELANNNTIEKIVYKILPNSKNSFDAPDDLVQDIYLLLLQKEDSLIEGLYTRGELVYYLLRIVRNQLLSANSPYFCLYIKFRNKSDGLETAAYITSED